MFESVAVELPGMPEAPLLRRHCTGGETVVSFGRRLVFEYADGDLGMRNLAIAALRDAGVSGLEIAQVFDLSPAQVSRLRARVRRLGSAGLAPLRGRPPKLSKRNVATVRRLAAEGISKTEIAKRFGVARSVIGETLKKFGPAPVQEPLGQSAPDADDSPVAKDGPVAKEAPDNGAPDADDAPDDSAPAESAPSESEQAESGPCGGISGAGLARIATGEHPSRYAGASLLYPYLDMVGAADVFSTLSGGRARRYDDLSVLATAVTGFALGIDTVEGFKHLRRSDAGALVGVREIPELRTFRERLSALADGSDPLALQRAFAKATLLADPPTSPVYYVDDHFVAYTGGRPVAKGWNTKRRCAGPGRDDTHVCDERGRAVVFASSEPSGLSATMPSVLSQLREVVGLDAPILLGFDRGGSYPKAFRACREANMDWITYRRGKLAEVKGHIKRSWVVRGERRVVVTVADEVINIGGYGRARQLTLFERGQAVLQVLTSDMTASGAALLLWLRGRWSIENLFKYASSHNGIDSIASYLMDVGPDDRLVANPVRKAARARVAAAEAALTTAERALAQSLCDPGRSVEETNAEIAGLQHAVDLATVALTGARGALVGIPAKVPATELDPGAKRAKMRLERRGLQMVCRLLAFNAEAWLAEHFNVYLGDPDENRAIMRHLLHLGGSFSYQHSTITVTLDRPDSPRVARALGEIVKTCG